MQNTCCSPRGIVALLPSASKMHAVKHKIEYRQQSMNSICTNLEGGDRIVLVSGTSVSIFHMKEFFKDLRDLQESIKL